MTLLQLATRRAGPIRGAKVLAFMIAWQTARNALGSDWPTGPGDGIEAQVRAYAEWWREHERTGWRELERFRAVFPAELTPSRLMDLAEAAVWDKRRGVRGLGAVEFPAA